MPLRKVSSGPGGPTCFFKEEYEQACKTFSWRRLSIEVTPEMKLDTTSTSLSAGTLAHRVRIQRPATCRRRLLSTKFAVRLAFLPYCLTWFLTWFLSWFLPVVVCDERPRLSMVGQNFSDLLHAASFFFQKTLVTVDENSFCDATKRSRGVA